MDVQLSTSLKFFSLKMRIPPNHRHLSLQVVMRDIKYLPEPRIELRSSVFLGECVVHLTTVADNVIGYNVQ